MRRFVLSSLRRNPVLRQRTGAKSVARGGVPRRAAAFSRYLSTTEPPRDKDDGKSSEDSVDTNASSEMDEASRKRLNEYSTLLNETARKRYAKEALKILSLLRTHELEPTLVHYNSALVANLDDREGVDSIAKEMLENEVSANLITYAALIRAAEIDSDPSTALMYTKRMARLLRREGDGRIDQLTKAHREMESMNLPPPSLTVNSLVVEFVEENQPKRALDVFRDAQEHGTKISLSALHILASSFESSGQRTRAKYVRGLASPSTVLCFESLSQQQQQGSSSAGDVDASKEAADADYYQRMTETDLTDAEKKSAWEDWKRNKTFYYG